MTEKAYAAIRAFLQREPVPFPYEGQDDIPERSDDEGLNYQRDFRNAAEAVIVAIFGDYPHSFGRDIDVTVFETQHYGVVHVPEGISIDRDGEIDLDGVDFDAIPSAIGACLKVVTAPTIVEDRPVFLNIVRLASDRDHVEHFVSRVRAAAEARATIVEESEEEPRPTPEEMTRLRSLMRLMAANVSGKTTSPYGGLVGILCSTSHEGSRPCIYPLAKNGVTKTDHISARNALGDLGNAMVKIDRIYSLRDDVVRRRDSENALLAQIETDFSEGRSALLEEHEAFLSNAPGRAPAAVLGLLRDGKALPWMGSSALRPDPDRDALIDELQGFLKTDANFFYKLISRDHKVAAIRDLGERLSEISANFETSPEP